MSTDTYPIKDIAIIKNHFSNMIILKSPVEIMFISMSFSFS